MNLPKLAIKRPIFISCIVLLIVILGLISFKDIGLDLLPNIEFPIVVVRTIYPGASPSEMESLIAKPIEDELAAVAGLKHIRSENTEGFSVVVLEFNMDVNVDVAAQDVRDKVSLVRNKLPTDLTDDPVVQRVDPDSSPVLKLAVMSNLPPAKIYDLANERIKTQVSRVKDVGTVDIIGGNRREIQIEIDQNKMNEYRMSMINLVAKMQASGSNIPIGRQEHGSTQTVFRSMGDYTSVEQIGSTLLSFSGDVGGSVSINTIGRVRDGVVDITSQAYVYYPEQAEKAIAAGSARGVQPCVYLSVIKQSGTNTVSVCDGVKKELVKINKALEQEEGNSKVIVVMDQSRWIRVNVHETVASILIGIVLAVFVVFLFLGNIRSTVITAIAIPNSLLGAIVVMYFMGYTFNIMTLMGLSIVVGLLVDDAIVVRENIFRKLEDGMESHKAAEKGTLEVMLAVIATTFTIIAVFFPIGMLGGIIGQLFKQFGFTVIFAMLVSLFDALTVAPFLSAYFAGEGVKSSLKIITAFERFQTWLEHVYAKIIHFCLARPIVVVIFTFLVVAMIVPTGKYVKKTFFPVGDRGEFTINIETTPGTSLEGTRIMLEKIEDEIRQMQDLSYYAVTVGDVTTNVVNGSIDCFFKEDRSMDTLKLKDAARDILSRFDGIVFSVDDPGGRRSVSNPFQFIISGNDLQPVEDVSLQIMEKIKDIPDLVDVNSTMKLGRPEFRLVFDDKQMQNLGVSSTTAGTEMRYNVTGELVGLFKEGGYNYNIRARLKPEQRDIQKLFNTMKVPNANGLMVNLSSVAKGEFVAGSTQINRMDKAYITRISANVATNSGLRTAMDKVTAAVGNVEMPHGVTYSFSGQSESSAETGAAIVFALIMAVVFIYLVLSSLYESFITPMAILLAIPPALSGAFISLFITNFMLDIFSMIGMVMLVGLVTKNSILLVDNAVHNLNSGMERKEAIFRAGIRRLRPILMTTFAMIAGMFPLALGIGEAAKMRQSMGIAIIGGIILSTMISLIVVPAVFSFIDRFRAATEAKILVRRPDIDEL
ncbi:MAG: efflux RND transporter permease subunit [Leptospirales bacterium]|nr:efflux RND transporter permease subunit [Leptospirales bacterium]